MASLRLTSVAVAGALAFSALAYHWQPAEAGVVPFTPVWQTFAPEDKDFQIQFPGKPKEVESEWGRAYVLNIGDAQIFVEWIRPSSRFDLRGAARHCTDGWKKDGSVEVLEDKPADFKNIVGQEYLIRENGPPIRYRRGRVFGAGSSHLIGIEASGTLGFVKSGMVDRVLASFEF